MGQGGEQNRRFVGVGGVDARAHAWRTHLERRKRNQDPAEPENLT